MAVSHGFEFDLVFALPEGPAEEGAVLDALYEAGCGDGVVGLGASGLVGVGLTRSGRDPEAVISEAAEQAMTGLPVGAQLREVRPDLVSLADVAARLNVTRQALQKRPMPPPSLGGLYRASEMPPYLEAVSGKIRDGLRSARAWFAGGAGGAAGQRQDRPRGVRGTPAEISLSHVPNRPSIRRPSGATQGGEKGEGRPIAFPHPE